MLLMHFWHADRSNSNTDHGLRDIIPSKDTAYATAKSNSADGQKAKGITAGNTSPPLTYFLTSSVSMAVYAGCRTTIQVNILFYVADPNTYFISSGFGG